MMHPIYSYWLRFIHTHFIHIVKATYLYNTQTILQNAGRYTRMQITSTHIAFEYIFEWIIRIQPAAEDICWIVKIYK